MQVHGSSSRQICSVAITIFTGRWIKTMPVLFSHKTKPTLCGCHRDISCRCIFHVPSQCPTTIKSFFYRWVDANDETPQTTHPNNKHPFALSFRLNSPIPCPRVAHTLSHTITKTRETKRANIVQFYFPPHQKIWLLQIYYRYVIINTQCHCLDKMVNVLVGVIIFVVGSTNKWQLPFYKQASFYKVVVSPGRFVVKLWEIYLMFSVLILLALLADKRSSYVNIICSKAYLYLHFILIKKRMIKILSVSRD